MNEPSVLDVVKEKLRFWKRKPKAAQIEFPLEEFGKTDQVHTVQTKFPYLTILSMLFGLFAQSFLEKSPKSVLPAIIFYIACALTLVGSFFRKEIGSDPIPSPTNQHPFSMKVHWVPLVISLPLMVASFLTFNDNQFTWLNISLWTLAMIFFWLALLEKKETQYQIVNFRERIKNWQLNFKITPWTILLILTVVIIIFVRFYDLEGTPGEMFSDHAEKLLDVSDILEGKNWIFFPRNTGREAIQMYLTAAIVKTLDSGLTFISLKIGTALAGILTLPYIYLLGKYLVNKWVGWLALFLAGIAYWPNVISRVGLRFPLYPLFAAPVIYYLFRGIRESNRNKLVLSGFFLGIGLHGYSPTRFLPFIIIIAFCIFCLHRAPKEKKITAIWGLIILAITAFIVFLPLFRYWIEDPAGFNTRAFSRLTNLEAPFTDSPIMIFLKNSWNAGTMLFNSNGQIWVHSIPGRPALDLISAAFYFIGVIALIIRYFRFRNWEDLFLLFLVPLLMMPSILSLAFPDENPSLNRTAGAIIPVFIIVGIGFNSVFKTLYESFRTKTWKGVVIGFAVFLLITTASTNFDLVMNQYHDEFLAGAWNTSDIGKVIKGFSELTGSLDNAYVVPYPHWVDTRLVGINAGYPLKDYALWPKDFASTLTVEGQKLFILKGDDFIDLETLRTFYPVGTLYRHRDGYEGKDFMYWLVQSR